MMEDKKYKLLEFLKGNVECSFDNLEWCAVMSDVNKDALKEILLTLKSIENKICDFLNSEEEEENIILFTPIWECGWPLRMENVFRGNNVLFIGDLLIIHQNCRNYQHQEYATIKNSGWKIIPNFGNISFLEMKNILEEIYGIKLNQDIKEWVGMRKKYIRENIRILINQSLKFNHFHYCPPREDAQEEFINKFIEGPYLD